MAVAHDSSHDEHNEFHSKPFSAHHFDSAEQQFDSGKLGMWLFLVTEVLFFSGLFCAYSVYRANHPEIFKYASQFLSTQLGAINTSVLILSSLTMAWGVRCAQLGKNGGVARCMALTLICAAFFLGVKTFEYTEKAHKRLLWAGASVDANELGKPSQVFRFGEELPQAEFEDRLDTSLKGAIRYWAIAIVIPVALILLGQGMNSRKIRSTGYAGLICVVGIMMGIWFSMELHHATHAGEHHDDSHAVAAHETEHHGDESHAHDDEHHEGDSHNAVGEDGEDHETADGHTVVSEVEVGLSKMEHDEEHKAFSIDENAPENINIFFSIYYFMTGLHGFHIVCGMIAITWIFVRAVEGDFRPDYFGPVDYVGLYWHLVDLIWIYLFPLLYLIG